MKHACICPSRRSALDAYPLYYDTTYTIREVSLNMKVEASQVEKAKVGEPDFFLYFSIIAQSG